mgnify:CR=1 FL=1
MKALTYKGHGVFALLDKPKPAIETPRDAVVRVTLGSICTSDLHIKHGSVPRAVPNPALPSAMRWWGSWSP